MVFSLPTVVFYAASSLGDKYISAKLACNAQEFSFLVALSTAFFLALVLPFTGWNFAFTLHVLVALKIAEFYTSAALHCLQILVRAADERARRDFPRLRAAARHARQNLLLYTLVQPMQLAILFLTALIRREKMGKLRLAGSIITLVAVTVMTVLIYFHRGAL